jgi:hypothetical protein
VADELAAGAGEAVALYVSVDGTDGLAAALQDFVALMASLDAAEAVALAAAESEALTVMWDVADEVVVRIADLVDGIDDIELTVEISTKGAAFSPPSRERTPSPFMVPPRKRWLW